MFKCGRVAVERQPGHHCHSSHYDHYDHYDHHYRCQHVKPGSKTSEESPEAGYRDESKEERQHAPETVRVGNLEELCTVSVNCDDQSVY